MLRPCIRKQTDVGLWRWRMRLCGWLVFAVVARAQPNSRTHFPAFSLADLIVSERFSIESDYFLELFNPTDRRIDTAGYRLCYSTLSKETLQQEHFAVHTTEPWTVATVCDNNAFVLPSHMLQPNDRLVICWTTDIPDVCRATLNPEVFGLASTQAWRVNPLILWRPLAEPTQGGGGNGENILWLDYVAESANDDALLTADYSWHRSWTFPHSDWNTGMATPGQPRHVDWDDVAPFGPVSNHVILAERLGPESGRNMIGSGNSTHFVRVYNAGTAATDITGYALCSEDLDNRCLTVQESSADKVNATTLLSPGHYLIICFADHVPLPHRRLREFDHTGRENRQLQTESSTLKEDGCGAYVSLIGESPTTWRRVTQLTWRHANGSVIEDNYCPRCAERNFYVWNGSPASFRRTWSHPGSEWVFHVDWAGSDVLHDRLRYLPPDFDPTTTIQPASGVPQHPIFTEYWKGGDTLETQAPWVEVYNPTSEPIELFKYFVCRIQDTDDCFWNHNGWDSVLPPGRSVVWCWTEESGCPGSQGASFYTPWLPLDGFDGRLRLWFGDSAGNGAGRWFVDTIPNIDWTKASAGQSFTRVKFTSEEDSWIFADPSPESIGDGLDLNDSPSTPSVPCVDCGLLDDIAAFNATTRCCVDSPTPAPTTSFRGGSDDDDNNILVIIIAVLVAVVAMSAVWIVYIFKRRPPLVTDNSEGKNKQEEKERQGTEHGPPSELPPPPFSPDHLPPPIPPPELVTDATVPLGKDKTLPEPSAPTAEELGANR